MHAGDMYIAKHNFEVFVADGDFLDLITIKEGTIIMISEMRGDGRVRMLADETLCYSYSSWFMKNTEKVL